MIEIDVFDFGHKLHFPSHCEPFRCVLFLLSSLSYSAIFEAYCDTKFSVGRQKMTLHLCPQSPPPSPGALMPGYNGGGGGPYARLQSPPNFRLFAESQNFPIRYGSYACQL